MGKTNLSRRNFLKGAALSTVGIAAVSLGGCAASGADGKSEGSTTAADGSEIHYEVINTDFLVIGGGNNAYSTAFWAAQQGKNVTLIDKGPYGFSGASGFNWDCYGCYFVGPKEYNHETGESGFVNAELVNASWDYDPWRNVAQRFLQIGEVLPRRNLDGTNDWYFELPLAEGFDMRMVEGLHFRNDGDTLHANPMVQVVDKTFVTDVVLNEGRCIGVTCVDLPTGDFKIYRAPVTVVATGAACQFYGWTGVSAFSINSIDNTGDVDMAAYRHGAGIGHAEFAGYDWVTTYPQGLGFGFGTMIDCDGNEPHLFCDKNGEQLFPDPNTVFTLSLDRAIFNQAIANRILSEDIATDDGQLTVNLNDKEMRYCFELNLEVFRRFGIDPFAQNIPIHCNLFERAAAPTVDSKMMTQFEGLFHARGAGSTDPLGGMTSSTSNMRLGAYVASCATDYADKAKDLKKLDWGPAEEEFVRLHELLSRFADGGKRPGEVRHLIQRACEPSMGSIRRKEDLEKTAAELDRIRKEEMPKMIVSTQSRTYNTEWKEAIENYNLLDEAELAVKATLEREESRGQYLYVDFPVKDDENWNCMLVASKKDDGIDFTKTDPNQA